MALYNGSINANSTEIRLIEADGTNDRLLWRVPNTEFHHISDVSWSPDGTHLAFSSDDETACSLYRSDIYTIKPDGSNLRRVTNGPACADLATYPKGTVTIDIENRLLSPFFLLYVEGAPAARQIIVNSGAPQRITVTDVADFGVGVQQRIVIFQTEQTGWLHPTAVVDVQPNGTAAAADTFVISNNNQAAFYGAYTPSWRRDSQAIGHALGNLGAYQVAADPEIGAQGAALFPDGAHFADTIALSLVDDRVLLYNRPHMLMDTAGDSGSVAPILELTGNLYGMNWQPDGSSLVAGEVGGLGSQYANLFAYDFESQEIQQLTTYQSEFAAAPSVSPDGTALVFIYAPAADANAELRIMARDGSNVRSLGVNGLQPDWGIPSQSIPVTPMPSPTATVTPQPTATPGPTLDPGQVSTRIYLPMINK